MTSIEAAILWLTTLLSGSLVTLLATLAVAGVGFELMTGRLALRRGGMVIVGSFILLGAAVIAQGMIGLIDRSTPPAPPRYDYTPSALGSPSAAPSSAPSSAPPPAPASGNPFDPYGGTRPVN